MDLFMQILGATLIVIGLVGLFTVVGMMIYPMCRDFWSQNFGKGPVNPMRGGINPSIMLIALFALIALGVSILVLLSNVPADQLTPAQENLITSVDWMVKVSVGAILGLGGYHLTTLARGKGE